jgi:hypothetical protein
MKSLFKAEDSDEIIARINKISVTSKPQWGKMNSAQMLAHCTAPIKMAHGEIKGKRGLISFLFGKMTKNKFVKSNEPFGKNLPTDPKFIFPSTIEFEKSKEGLIKQLQAFVQKGPDGITKEPHSFFGHMTPQEWDIIQYKHLDHHLTQFGV